MTFIVWDKNGHRHSEYVRTDKEDQAWEEIHMMYPDAEYIELF